ncbi:MAG: XTP/dITP diphosphatase [Planctomycetes bacterium]|nr:XTP/dITP diphosphatase [Planctomycetota bacterium]MBI3843187.1 XTP/dITP diphosphatase [Planctomycetota bacterium]
MPVEIVIASRNPKKRVELEALLRGLDVRVIGADSFPEVPDVVEDGATFLDNARKKAFAFARALGKIALGDDSGLEVDALGRAPGVKSHRFAGPTASDADNNRLLLERLRGVPHARRTARFRCAAVVAWPDGSSIESEGSCEGVILEAPRGSAGFGYDPLFLSPEHDKTFAELSSDAKNETSHRARALARLREKLIERLSRAS